MYLISTKKLRSLRKRNRRGMSLMEVLIALAIVLAVGAMLMVGVMQLLGDSEVAQTELKLTEVAKRVEAHAVRKGAPSSADGLKTLYGDEVQTDAWGNPIVYTVPGPNGRKFDLLSYGADGQEGGTGNNADIKLSELGK